MDRDRGAEVSEVRPTRQTRFQPDSLHALQQVADWSSSIEGSHPSRKIRTYPVFENKVALPVLNQYGTGFVPYLSSMQHPKQIIPAEFCEDSSYSALSWVILAAILGLIGLLQNHSQSESEEAGSLGVSI